MNATDIPAATPAMGGGRSRGCIRVDAEVVEQPAGPVPLGAPVAVS